MPDHKRTIFEHLAAVDAARIVAARADHPFDSIDDMWRRASVSAASLVDLAARCPVTVTVPHLDLCYEIGDGRGFYKLEGVRRRDDSVAEV
nr:MULTISPECIES: type II secretion system protein GspK [Rhizobium]